MSLVRRLSLSLTLLSALPGLLLSQDRLKDMPGAEQFARVSPIIGQVNQQIAAGRVAALSWSPDRAGVNYSIAGRRFHVDVATGKASEGTIAGNPVRGSASPPGQTACAQFVDRGRQVESELSPDGSKLAVYRDRNLYLTTPTDCRAQKGTALTTDGSAKTRIKYGTAS